jgi:hypothetical protein
VPPATAPGTLQFDSGGVWQLHRDGDRLVFRLSSPKFGPLPYTTATMAQDFATGVVNLRRSCFTSRGPIYPLDYPLDELRGEQRRDAPIARGGGRSERLEEFKRPGVVAQRHRHHRDINAPGSTLLAQDEPSSNEGAKPKCQDQQDQSAPL